MRRALIATVFALITLTGAQPMTAQTMTAQSAPKPVTLINPFIVPAGKEDEALAMWQRARDFMAAQPGYISTTLHRALSPDARYAMINVAQWESLTAFGAAIAAMQAADIVPNVEGVSGDPQLYRAVSQ